MMFLKLCKAEKLNPFINEAYLVKFGSNPAQMVTSVHVFEKRASSCEEYDGKRAGIIVIRDVDTSCQSTTPSINSDDLVVLMVNTTMCFSGIPVRTEVYGGIIPESGMNGVISFTTPSAYIDTIIDLQ